MKKSMRLDFATFSNYLDKHHNYIGSPVQHRLWFNWLNEGKNVILSDGTKIKSTKNNTRFLTFRTS